MSNKCGLVGGGLVALNINLQCPDKENIKMAMLVSQICVVERYRHITDFSHCSRKAVMAYRLYQWTLLSFRWTWLSAWSSLWSALAVWCKTGSRRRWVLHTCYPSPPLLDNCRSWSWDRPEEGVGRCGRTECDVGAGSCPQTCPFGGRWPPCRRRSEGPPPWWQLLMRPPQPLTAPDHSWQNTELWSGAENPLWS